MAHHIHCHIHYGSGVSTGDKPTFGSMDEVKHDPKNGQFAAGGSGKSRGGASASEKNLEARGRNQYIGMGAVTRNKIKRLESDLKWHKKHLPESGNIAEIAQEIKKLKGGQDRGQQGS